MEIPKTKTTMRQEIISDKAQDYVSRLYAENEYPCGIRDIESDVMEAFEDGANWRIDSVWHNMSEKPNGLFVILADFGEEEYSLGITLDGIESAKRWAYVSDLLPDRKDRK